MKVIVEGEADGKFKRIQFDMLDRYDESTQMSSMSRTTGFTCTAAVNLMAKKMFSEKGVFPPELMGKHKNCFDFVVDYLKQRGVIWRKSE